MDDNGENDNGNGNGGNDDGEGNGNGDENENGENGGNGGEPSEGARAAAIDYGEQIDDFAGGGNWFAFDDEQLTADDSEVVSGENSLRVEKPGGGTAIIGRAFSSAFDLSEQYVSIALKVAAPVGGQFQLEVRAPGGDDRVTATRRLPSGVDEWFRVDLGYSLGFGSPDFTNVQEIRLAMSGPEGEDIQFWVDDMRTTPAQDESNVILAFYGGLESHYETVFPLLEERGWVGALGISQDLLNRPGRLDIDQLREMRDAGWDVCSYPMHAGDMTGLSADEQRRVVESNRDYLANRGFEDGARHFFTPRNRMNTDLLNVLRDTHETAFVFGANSSGIPPTGRHTIPAINGSDYDGSRAPILRADIHNQVVVPYFEDIGEEGMSVEDFEAQLDRIEDNTYGGGLEPITPTQLLERY
ncbi:MAG: polysaccharide deacetylase family protein [Halalkalicoccus sp.]